MVGEDLKLLTVKVRAASDYAVFYRQALPLGADVVSFRFGECSLPKSHRP